MGWGKVADTVIASTQLIGASFNATNVSVYVADLSVSNFCLVHVLIMNGREKNIIFLYPVDIV